jgi:hypothetical protein
MECAQSPEAIFVRRFRRFRTIRTQRRDEYRLVCHRAGRRPDPLARSINGVARCGTPWIGEAFSI